MLTTLQKSQRGLRATGLGRIWQQGQRALLQFLLFFDFSTSFGFLGNWGCAWRVYAGTHRVYEVKPLSHVQLFEITWTVAMPGSSARPRENLPDPRIKPRFPELKAASLQSETPGKPQ